MRYQVFEAVAGGGMGVVYRARDRVTGAQVALKRVSPDLAERFDREAAVLAALAHPGIVRYLDHGRDPEPYLAMQWLDGETLRARLAREGVSTAEALAIARRTAVALAAAHARGVAHRDVKPSNVMLTGAGPVLIDFGLARRRHETLALTGEGIMLGTPGYASPEQVWSARDSGPRTDVFALGCVIYECLAGVPAFPGGVPGAPPLLARRRGDLPRALVHLIAQMMSKAPSLRPPAAAVAAAIAQLPPLAAPERRPVPEDEIPTLEESA